MHYHGNKIPYTLGYQQFPELDLNIYTITSKLFFAFFLLSVFSHMFCEYSRWKYAKHALVSTWTGSFILIEKVETEEIHQRTRKRIQTTKSLYIYQIDGVKARWF